MSSKDKQILERAIANGLLTEDQATRIARIRHNRKERDGSVPGVAEVAVEKGFLTREQADRLAAAQDAFEQDHVIAGYRLVGKLGLSLLAVAGPRSQFPVRREPSRLPANVAACLRSH